MSRILQIFKVSTRGIGTKVLSGNTSKMTSLEVDEKTKLPSFKRNMDPNAYMNHVLETYASGVTMINMAIGKKMGLFKIICDANTHLTSKEVADQGGKKERYVREWLNSMVLARVIQLDTTTGGYYLTAGQKKVLASSLCIAPFALVLAERANTLMDCFNKDGPYSYGTEEGFAFEYSEELRRDTGKDDIEVNVIPFLKQQNLFTILGQGIRVVDLGCGNGYYIAELATHFPSSTFTGVDLNETTLAIARQKTSENNLTNLTFQQGDAHELPAAWTSAYDMVVMFDTLHALPGPSKVLSEIHRILKPDGSYMLCDLGFHSDPQDNIGNVMAHLCQTISVFLCLPSGMSAEPREGKGACWGMENMEKTLTGCNFKIDGKCPPPEYSKRVIYHCTKVLSNR